MLVIARKDGQLGNKLAHFAHFIALSCETGVPVMNPCFGEYAEYFESTSNDLWCRYPVCSQQSPPKGWKRKFLPKATYRIAKLIHQIQSISRLVGWTPRIINVVYPQGSELLSFASPEVLQQVSRTSIWVGLGWQVSSGQLRTKYIEVIRRHFQPKPIHQQQIERKTSELRSAGNVVIGVHIRQGDYSWFEGGKYYYQLADYRRWMQLIVDQMPNQRVVFLVCGNGSISAKDFDGLPVKMGPGHMVEDMYCLARTDLIIGPPSTFSGWAAFYGDVPLIYLESVDQTINVQAALASRAAAA